jgi:hypothetical protein
MNSGAVMGGRYCIYVVLSRSQAVLSQVIRILKRDEYTHAALSLDRELRYMFSFGRRRRSNPFIGCYKRECLDEGFYRCCCRLPGAVIEVPVSPAQYSAVCGRIQDFLLNSHRYDYNYIGLIGNLVGMPYRNDNRFFCSEFVYHVLHKSGICDFGIPRNLVRPQDLSRLDGAVIYKGDLKKYAPEKDPYGTTAEKDGQKRPVSPFAFL